MRFRLIILNVFAFVVFEKFIFLLRLILYEELGSYFWCFVVTKYTKKDVSAIIEKLKKFFEEKAPKFKVHYAMLFGSFAKNTVTPLSDVDIAVKTDGNLDTLALLAYELEEIIPFNFD